MAKGDFRFDFKWNGEQVRKNVVKATIHGIDHIMGRCVGTGKEDVPVASATYQGSIRIVEPAAEHGDEIYGVWGSVDVNYALAIETGDFSYLKGLPNQSRQSVPTRKNKGNRGSLRKAADQHYPDLPSAISGGVK